MAASGRSAGPIHVALALAATALLGCGTAASDGGATPTSGGPAASSCPEGRVALREVPDAYRACDTAADCTHVYDGCCRGVWDVGVSRRYAACVQTAPCEQPGQDNVCPAVEPTPPTCVGGLCR